MYITGLIDEDFINYKKPSMFIGTCYCDFKCCKEANLPITICQNHSLLKKGESKIIDDDKIINRYLNNNITEAIVFGGLEPFLQFEEINNFISKVRESTLDDIVIYTGYNKEEIKDKLFLLKQYKNIIIKFGRFVPNQQAHFDDVLGVNLVSDNQYAEKIS